MSSSRVWLFRGLVIVAAGLMLLSWFMPWWSADSSGDLELKNAVIIHPYGLEQNMGEFAVYIAGSEMPAWFAPVAWTFLGICIAALLLAAWIENKDVRLIGRNVNLSKLLVGVVGFLYIFAAVLAVIVAAIRTADYGLTLQGHTDFERGPARIGVDASAQFGYILAYGVGLLCIALAFLREKIVGQLSVTRHAR
jgi:hypothetical protein